MKIENFSSRVRCQLLSAQRKGFTLVELLIVIGLIAVLATVVVVVLNPAEFLARGRDAKRNSDIDLLDKALSIYDLQSANYTGVSSNIVYISLPDDGDDDDADTIVDDCDELSLPALPVGWRYKCATTTTYRSTTGSGWIPLNFSQLSSLALATLPVDPVNTASNELYYTYIKGSWNVTAKMESNSVTRNLASRDTGQDPTRYEKGTDLTLWNQAQGLVAYWKLDETTGTTATDSSGSIPANTGTINGSPAPVAGKVGSALGFNLNNENTQYVDENATSSFAATDQVSLVAWFKLGADAVDSSTSQTIINSKWVYIHVRLDIANNANRVFVRTDDNTSQRSAVFNIGLGDTSWHHVVGVYRHDGTNEIIKIYLDGVLRNTLTVAATPTTPYTPAIAKKSTTYFNGTIDDVRIYNRVLSDSEVTALYNATR